MTAGLIGMALKQHMGKPIYAQDVFAHLRLFPVLLLPAVGAAIAWSFFSNALWFWVGPRWDDWIAMPFESLVSGLFMFTLPIMIDRGLSVRDATRETVRLLGSQYPRAVAYHFWASFVSFLGVFLCGVGFLWTCPIIYISVARAYVEIVGLSEEVEAGFPVHKSPAETSFHV